MLQKVGRVSRIHIPAEAYCVHFRKNAPVKGTNPYILATSLGEEQL